MINLTNFYDELLDELLDGGRAVDVVHLDISKAFDTVSLKILTEKMLKHELDANALKTG